MPNLDFSCRIGLTLQSLKNFPQEISCGSGCKLLHFSACCKIFYKIQPLPSLQALALSCVDSRTHDAPFSLDNILAMQPPRRSRHVASAGSDAFKSAHRAYACGPPFTAIGSAGEFSPGKPSSLAFLDPRPIEKPVEGSCFEHPRLLSDDFGDCGGAESAESHFRWLADMCASTDSDGATSSSASSVAGGAGGGDDFCLDDDLSATSLNSVDLILDGICTEFDCPEYDFSCSSKSAYRRAAIARWRAKRAARRNVVKVCVARSRVACSRPRVKGKFVRAHPEFVSVTALPPAMIWK
jgi:hypothetical protein